MGIHKIQFNLLSMYIVKYYTITSFFENYKLELISSKAIGKNLGNVLNV